MDNRILDSIRWIPFISTEKEIMKQLASFHFDSVDMCVTIGFDSSQENYILDVVYSDRQEKYCIELEAAAVAFSTSLAMIEKLKQEEGKTEKEIWEDINYEDKQNIREDD